MNQKGLAFFCSNTDGEMFPKNIYGRHFETFRHFDYFFENFEICSIQLDFTSAPSATSPTFRFFSKRQINYIFKTIELSNLKCLEKPLLAARLNIFSFLILRICSTGYFSLFHSRKNGDFVTFSLSNKSTHLAKKSYRKVSKIYVGAAKIKILRLSFPFL
jgi:hypothetical protein